MKVLYLIPGLGGGGGAEQSLAAMIPYWANAMDLHLVTFKEGPALGDEVERTGVEHTRVSAGDRLELIRQVDHLVRSVRPDLIHTTLFEADIAGRIVGVKNRVPVSSSLVNVNYGPEQFAIPGQRAATLRSAHAADALSARTVSRFHALTEHVANVMSKRLLIRRSKVDVIPRGRSVEALGVRTQKRREEARSALGVGPEPLIVAAARHEWQKGLDVLIRAMPSVLRLFPNARVLIGGRQGLQTTLLESLVKEIGLSEKVDFIGLRSDVPELMCAADVFCVPSRWEGFGSILIEAMALETPTVSTAIGPIEEVAGSNPWLRLVPPNNPEALARAIAMTLRDESGSAKLTDIGRQRFKENYTAEVVAERMLDFFARARSG